MDRGTWRATVWGHKESDTTTQLTAPKVEEAEKILETHLELLIILPDY